MGISYNAFDRIAELSSRYQPKGRALMLGRQLFRMRKSWERVLYGRILRRYRQDVDVASLSQPDHFAEAMFAGLGFGKVESMDVSDFEFDKDKGGVLHDLNVPIPDTLRGKFDFIYDGGTLEHIINLPMAFDNLFEMLAPGGRLLAQNPLNGYPNHGIYQFTPELVYTIWKRMYGCEVVQCRGMTRRSGRFVRDFEDEFETGQRLSFKTKWSPFHSTPAGKILLHYEVVKGPNAGFTGISQQASYTHAWGESGAPEMPHAGDSWAQVWSPQS